MKLIERFRHWLAFKLLMTKTMTATQIMLMDKVRKTRCDHCGKHPYKYLDE